MQTIILFVVYTATISGAVLLLYAAHSGNYRWAYLSAILATPICFYVAGYPALYYVPIVFPIGILLGAHCIKIQRPVLALLFFTPYLILCIGIIVTILVNIEY